MERRIDEDLEKLGMADAGEFTGEQPALGDAVETDRLHDEDGYVASDGLMAPHQEPAEVQRAYEQGLDERERNEIEDLRGIHDGR